jgi:3-oxoacyl-[acyl-carrier-protein] synthase-1
MVSTERVGASEIPLLLCVSEEGRPGRLAGLDETFLQEVQARLGLKFHQRSALIAGGRLGAVHALDQARKLIETGYPYCVVAGVDSFLIGQTLAAYDAKGRLQTAANSDGFIPGEAGAAVLVGPASQAQGMQVACLGLGYGMEPAPLDSREPSRGEGLVQAFQAVLADSGADFTQLDYRITDNSGEQHGFKEAALALTRVLRERKEEFDIWHPADCIGEVGAAILPVVLGVALAAAKKGYAPGSGILCHFSDDGGERAAMVLRAENRKAA